MLVEIKKLGEIFQKRFEATQSWPELSFADSDKELIKQLPNVKDVYRSSVVIQSPTELKKHSHIPSQYMLYAALIKEFAEALYSYIAILKELKNSDLSNAQVHQLILDRDSNYPAFTKLSDQETEYFFNLFGKDKEHALGAKSILSEKDGAKGLRGEKDFFSSVILQVINVPNSSNSLLGELVYYLSEKPNIYEVLQRAYIKNLAIIAQESVAGSFAASVFRFLWNYDRLEKVRSYISQNEDVRFLSIANSNSKLTSVFQQSERWLEESELSSGGKIRFTEKPQFVIDGNFIYISTEWTSGKDTRLDIDSLKTIVESEYKEFEIEITEKVFTLKPSKYHTLSNSNSVGVGTSLPKPFILLAGISGTGKSRFVRRQADFQGRGNHILIPVRPDWHEPSDLLGYVSKINGEKYVTTEFLKFVVKAWIDAYDYVSEGKIFLKDLSKMTTFWACLDEMNLAPVEQYFADYLSVIETRQWNGKTYECEALVNPAQMVDETCYQDLKKDLGLLGNDDLWKHFIINGISIPPNLIVAGTVNMDETTHGFSRKVIDRAFTIDFGAFFPNDFNELFHPKSMPKPLVFSMYSNANMEDLSVVAADPDGDKSIGFLIDINSCLHGTPFELAFRALNELLLAVKCFSPKDDEELSAVWDDFIMTKLLPRIEGDTDKLRFNGEESLLTSLQNKIAEHFNNLNSTGFRPDLLRTSITGDSVSVEIRSLKKIAWMHERLVNSSFTSFWA